MNQKTLIRADNLKCISPTGVPLLHDLSFNLNGGEILAFTGPNGTGKTTLLRALHSEKHLCDGTLNVFGKTSFLGQLHGRHFHIPVNLFDIINIFHTHINIQVKILNVGLLQEHELSVAWNHASGGQKQKTLLTSILLSDTPILLLDEPMNHLDPQSRSLVSKILKRRIEDQKSGIILVCHQNSLTDLDCPTLRTINLSRYAPQC